MAMLTFRASPNYEKPADADGDNVYEVTVAATDADSNRGERSVEVKVANVPDEDWRGDTVGGPAACWSVGDSQPHRCRRWSNRCHVAVEHAGGDIEGATSDTYTPTADELNDMLTATAMYTDAKRNGCAGGLRLQMDGPGWSANNVAADTRNKAPVFADQDAETPGRYPEHRGRKDDCRERPSPSVHCGRRRCGHGD